MNYDKPVPVGQNFRLTGREFNKGDKFIRVD